jgi:hypothetical protein
MKKHIRKTLAELRSFGATIMDIKQGPHFKIHYRDTQGRDDVLIVSTTPSDRVYVRNQRAFLRHKFRPSNKQEMRSMKKLTTKQAMKMNRLAEHLEAQRKRLKLTPKQCDELDTRVEVQLGRFIVHLDSTERPDVTIRALIELIARMVVFGGGTDKAVVDNRVTAIINYLHGQISKQTLVAENRVPINADVDDLYQRIH